MLEHTDVEFSCVLGSKHITISTNRKQQCNTVSDSTLGCCCVCRQPVECRPGVPAVQEEQDGPERVPAPHAPPHTRCRHHDPPPHPHGHHGEHGASALHHPPNGLPHLRGSGDRHGRDGARGGDRGVPSPAAGAQVPRGGTSPGEDHTYTGEIAGWLYPLT